MAHILNLYKLYLLGFLASAAVGIAYGSYTYINKLQERAAEATQLEQQLEAAIQQAQNIAEAQRKLNKQLIATRQQAKLLEQKLENNRLKQTSIAKPQTVERIINRAGDNSFRCFELLSGSALTDRERSAQNANEFNSECPWLYNELITTK